MSTRKTDWLTTSGLTYIIIILILISIFVTCSEVFLRFGILSARVRLRQLYSTLTPGRKH